MKPLNRKNYGSIPHLSNSKLGENDHFIGIGQERILTQKKRDKHDTILVFEKYDGSNVGIAKKEGEIFALTRNGYEASTSPYRQHHEFTKWVKKREAYFKKILNEGERLIAEWLLQAHGIIYKITSEPIVFFDYFDAENNRFTYDKLKNLDLPLPRMLHQGEPARVEELLSVLNQKTEHIKSNENPEGMVYRVERKEQVDFLAKWVSPDFEPGKYCIGIEDEKLIYHL